MVQGCLLPDVLDVGLCPGVQKLLDALRVAVLGSAVQRRLLVTIGEIHIQIWDTRPCLEKNPGQRALDCLEVIISLFTIHLTRS